MVAPDPSPYYAIPPGQTLERPPHRLRCAGCGSTDVIFDARTDGYDGRLNGGAAYESGETGEAFTQATYEVIAMPTYNISLEELTELAPMAGPAANPADLFDWFNLVGKPDGDAPPFEWSYECA